MTALPQNVPADMKKDSRRKPYRFWLILGISFASAMLILATVIVVSIVAQVRWSARQHWVEVAMMGNRPIRNITIKVSGAEYRSGHIEGHTSGRIRYDATAASDFEVKVTFEDGASFSGNCGSVTPATPPGVVTIVVNEDGTLSYSDVARP